MDRPLTLDGELKARIAILEARLKHQSETVRENLAAMRASVEAARVAFEKSERQRHQRESVLCRAVIRARAARGAFDYDTSFRLN